MEAASSVQKELVRGVMSRKRTIDEQEQATDSNGDVWWLRIRHRLEEIVRAANLGTAAEEKMLLGRVREQVERMIEQEKADAFLNRQKAGKSQKADAFQDAAVTAIQQERADPGDIQKAAKEMKAHAAVLSVGEHEGAAERPKPTQFRGENLVKQSGVPQVCWIKDRAAWQVTFPRLDSKGKKIGQTARHFPVKKFIVPGRSEAEADAAALEAAKAFRAELVQQGVLSKPRDPNFTSEVPGVAWHKGKQKWRVEICHKGSKKSIWGGRFTEKAAAEAKALELREQHRLSKRKRQQRCEAQGAACEEAAQMKANQHQ
eukprot:Skav221150  [mRNA]  locus=scaffold2925:158461:159408:+ [translate_table: standard]